MPISMSAYDVDVLSNPTDVDLISCIKRGLVLRHMEDEKEEIGSTRDISSTGTINSSL